MYSNKVHTYCFVYNYQCVKKGTHQYTSYWMTAKYVKTWNKYNKNSQILCNKTNFEFFLMAFRITFWNIVTWNSEERHPTTVCKCASKFVLILCRYMYISRQCILILVHACMMQNRDFAFTKFIYFYGILLQLLSR